MVAHSQGETQGCHCESNDGSIGGEELTLEGAEKMMLLVLNFDIVRGGGRVAAEIGMVKEHLEFEDWRSKMSASSNINSNDDGTLSR